MAFKIALDAGHGLNTAGKNFLASLDPNETREWVRNSLVCDKIESKLYAQYEGFELLRVDDRTGAKDISRLARCKAANNFKADFYLSMHHNAGIKGGTGGGITVYAWKKADATLQAQQKQLYDLLIAHTGLKGNRAVPLGRANFDVLVYSNMPAILVEAGFMDSATDVPIILTDAFAEQVADACVEFLAQVGNLKKKVATDTNVGSTPAPTPTPAPAPVKPTAIYQVYAGGKWWAPIEGYNTVDSSGYAGVFGKEISGIRVKLSNGATVNTRSHIKGRLKASWLSAVTKWDDTPDGYSGIYNKAIDCIALKAEGCTLKYRVHVKGGNWLDWVTKADIKDAVNGVAGIYGKPIDAIQIDII